MVYESAPHATVTVSSCWLDIHAAVSFGRIAVHTPMGDDAVC
jgi:hypothetical protein